MKKSRLAVERQKEIYNTISLVGTVYVANLSKKFNATKETIRKDLEALEKEGIVQRTHGGAVLNHKMPVQRHMTNVDVKSSIAREAAQLVEKGDIIALDSSDFFLQLAKQLRDREITVDRQSIPACGWRKRLACAG
ncbi:DeoR family transcriptional regulator [Paenibacillus thiaminolyticus]|nr:DeoR family transcriptional regulator [Paenibacillus thiaminolyticus]